MRQILLTRGKFALVDNADYAWLSQWKWFASQTRFLYYARRGTPVVKDKRAGENMHRLILGLQPGDKRQCDHIDGDGLNNQRSNLRICTATQNQQNTRKQKSGSSRYKGVSRYPGNRKWRSQIQVSGKTIHLGYFSSEKAAAIAYNQAALKHFGEFAYLNSF